MHQPLTSLTLVLFVSLGLSACGGGGGAGAGVTNNSTSLNNSVTNKQQNIPTNPYPVGSGERGGWDVLQNARQLCGFGTLAQSTKLDKAAWMHANYLTSESVRLSSTVMEHGETNTTNSFFKDNDPLIRAQMQNYGVNVSVAVAEILAGTTWPTNYGTLPPLEQSGGSSMRDLLNTVYHLMGAMYDGPDVGFGASSQLAAQGTEFRFGSLNGFESVTPRIKLGAGVLATYPCAGSSNIPPSFIHANETPDPFSNPTLTPNIGATVGPPIYLKVDTGSTLVVNAATSTISLNGKNVPTILLTQSNDPTNPKQIGTNEAFVVPTQPLNSGKTTYQVTLNGTINGTAFTRSFTMETSL